MTESLTNLDDPKIFVHGIMGTVHAACSPWSSDQLEAAYAQSQKYGSMIGTSAPAQARTLNQALPRNHWDCNACLAKFSDDEWVMGVPVTVQEHSNLSKKRKKDSGIAKCTCPNLINGHYQSCDYV